MRNTQNPTVGIKAPTSKLSFRVQGFRLEEPKATTIGVCLIRIGLGGILHDNYNEEPGRTR